MGGGRKLLKGNFRMFSNTGCPAKRKARVYECGQLCSGVDIISVPTKRLLKKKDRQV